MVNEFFPIIERFPVGRKNYRMLPVSFITAKVFSSIKMSTNDRETMRRTLERDITELIEKINALLQDVRLRVREAGKKDILFVMDGLDRLRSGLDKNIFQGGGSILKSLRGNFIYVVPISLLYDEQARLLPFDEQVILPMIPIYQRGATRQVNKQSIEFLNHLIGKRITLEEVFTHP
ncbi:MAG: hypothetical protein ETSY2_42920 [Candidatus Entotheonella gemina]|uniref:KAP NTPase domain-containing protein n=1 Tax=Candidatus Entotheonella gemina TaxID=1429439 RepID=W4LK84_9BACT|nr:MAG: hypothetical protein ETSY2_42920 [Candidatus Entotheonella gemina]